VGGGIKGEYLRRILALSSAAGVAAAVFFARRTGVLEGIPALAFAVLLVLVLPISSVLSRRILVGGSIFIGWVPLLWWVRLPVPQVDRMGILLALISGALVFWLLWAPDVRVRVRRLVPQVAVVDAMPLVAGGLATWTMWPLFNVPGAARLAQLLSDVSGWDHVSHSSMVLMMRAKGVMEPMMGLSPDGSAWVWSGYPQHPHAAVVSLIELQNGTSVGDAATEFIRYGHGVALMVVLVAVLLAAGVAQLPTLRNRGLIAWPLGAMTVAAFLFGLGSWSVSRAWWNWLVTCAAIGLAALLAVSMSGEIKPLKVFALGGLVVTTVHGWPLLAPLAVVAAAVAFVPNRRDLWPRTHGGWGAMIAVLVATVAASLAVLPILRAAGGMDAVTAQNDILSGKFTRLTPALLTGGAALAVTLTAYVRNRSRESAARGAGLAAVPVVAFLLMLAVAAYQLAVVHTVSYYFDKLVLGVGLICVPIVAAGVAVNLGPSPSLRGSRLRRSAALLASTSAALAALMLFGLSGLEYRLKAGQVFDAPAPVGERILGAAEVSLSRPFGESVYLGAMPGDPRASLSYYYQLSLSLMWTKKAGGRGSEVLSVLDDADKSDGNRYDGLNLYGAVQAANTLLEANADCTVIVAPEIADSVRGLLPAELRSRVLTWGSP
jgi:hypothetical protein